MTTTRINHRACKHPATNAARTACRKALAQSRILTAAQVAADRACHQAEMDSITNPLPLMNTISGSHCQACGRPETWTPANEGYSACCNERIVDVCDSDDCYHA